MLEAESANLTGDSKAEFDEAKPFLQGLLRMNVNTQYPQTLRLEAAGHAGFSNQTGQRTRVYGTCSVKIEALDAKLV